MGMGYKDIAGEPFGVVGESLADYSIMGNSLFRKKRRKNKRASRRTRRHHTKSGKKRRSKRKSHRVSRRIFRKEFAKWSKGGIRYTKNGQPYKIMPNGRARFIKK